MKRTTMIASAMTMVTVFLAPVHASAAPTQERLPTPDIVDPLRIQAAKDMLNASRAVRNARVGAALGFEAALNARFASSSMADDEELIAVARKAGLTAMSKVLDEIVPKMIDDLALTYSQKLTVDQMQEVTAFYQSATGQKLLDLMPALTAETSAKMQELVKPYIPEVSAAVQEELERLAAQREKAGAAQ